MKNTRVRTFYKIEDVPDNPRFTKQVIIDGLLAFIIGMAITFFSLVGISVVMYLVHVRGIEF